MIIMNYVIASLIFLALLFVAGFMLNVLFTIFDNSITPDKGLRERGERFTLEDDVNHRYYRGDY